jgi:hypothetical protein
VFIPATDAEIALGVDLPIKEVTEGATLTGTVLADAAGDVNVVGCEVALIRTTTYVYRQGNLYGGAMSVPTRATEVLAARGIPCSGPLRAGSTLTLPFTLEVPADGPGTVAGALVQVQWAVRVRLQVSGSPAKEHTRAIVVLSRARDLAPVADEPPATVDRRLVVLRFESLSSRRLVPATILSGLLAVEPRRAGAARGLRVELVLREQVHRGPWVGTDPTRNPANEGRERDTVVAGQAIAHHIELDPRSPVALPFRLQVPDRLPAPSLVTERFSLTWILRGVADRALRPDPYVEVQLHGATSAG